MLGSVIAPGISGFELREAIGLLTNAIMRGAVETPLEASGGATLLTAAGEPLTARQTRQTQEVYTDIPAALWPIVVHVAAAERAEAERRITDNLMGALMTGNLSTTLTDRAGAALATSRGETIIAHQQDSAGSGQTFDRMIAGLFPLFERMNAKDISIRYNLIGGDQL